MRKRFVVVGMIVVAATAVSLTPARAAGQGSTAAPKAQAGAEKAPTTAIKRLPDGAPDIRGRWTKAGGGLDEAPNKALQETRLKPFGLLSEPQGFGQGQVTAGRGGAPITRGRGAAPANRPPVMIVDPPDRNLPYTPEGLARRIDYGKNVCCPAKSLDYIELSMRCIPPAPPAGGNLYVTQRPGEVAFLFERDHQGRVIYTDGRPHPPASVTFFGGHSIGHWEGNTLVVDTTNMDGRIHFSVGGTIAPFSKELHFTERYTVVSDKLITYELVYIDPKTFTQPVKVVGYMAPPTGTEEFEPEHSCHEGSYALWDTFGF